ncbi:TPA: hypothetical protein DDW35_03285 [Candidatus Sumerlaeota bacterium]|jgi:hypothetical protein|nr:hypothetical protein [Candidatus Sumerlaeota bacterium]
MFNLLRYCKTGVVCLTATFISFTTMASAATSNTLGSTAITTTSASTSPSSTTLADQVIFPLKYRGWNEDDPALFLGKTASYVGDLQKTSETVFTKGLKLDAPQVRYYEVSALPQSPQIALTYNAQGKPTALYMDLNGNGKLDEGEKILPCVKPLWGKNAVGFITPDFEMQLAGKTFPYRLALHQGSYQHNNSISWQTACALEGSAKLKSQDVRLLLLDPEFPDLFGNYFAEGQSKLCLIVPSVDSAGKKSNKQFHQYLGHLLTGDREYYDLRFSDDNKSIILTPNTLPMSSLQVTVAGSSKMKTLYESIQLTAATQSDNHASIEVKDDKPIDLPAQAYKKLFMMFQYWEGAGEHPGYDADYWQVSIQTVKNLDIMPNQVVLLEFGSPKLSVQTFNGVPYGRGSQPQRSFHPGDPVFLSVSTVGKQGELYSFIARCHGQTRQFDLPYRVLNDVGTVVTSGTMSLMKGTRWETTNVAPGKYTVIVEQETGPLAGKLEAKLDIVIEDAVVDKQKH